MSKKKKIRKALLFIIGLLTVFSIIGWSVMAEEIMPMRPSVSVKESADEIAPARPELPAAEEPEDEFEDEFEDEYPAEEEPADPDRKSVV